MEETTCTQNIPLFLTHPQPNVSLRKRTKLLRFIVNYPHLLRGYARPNSEFQFYIIRNYFRSKSSLKMDDFSNGFSQASGMTSIRMLIVRNLFTELEHVSYQIDGSSQPFRAMYKTPPVIDQL